MLAYNEPGKDELTKITEHAAIQQMRDSDGEKRLIASGYDYTDRDALLDFMAIHWAWFIVDGDPANGEVALSES